MKIKFSNFEEYEDDIAMFGLYNEENHDESLYGKFITVPRHDPFDIIYFKYIRDMRVVPVQYCRISMTEAKYLDSDFILTSTEKDLIVKEIGSYWKLLVDAENEERRDNGIKEIILNSIPDYSILEVQEDEQ